MNGYFFQNPIIFLEFHTLRIILLILLCYVAACTWKTSTLVLGTFQNNLYPIAFFCHVAIFP